nr:hypothetical protein [Mycobacterium sp. MS1601]
MPPGSGRRATTLISSRHWRYTMAKRGRKKRDRKHSKANHGRRPNS